MTPLLKTILLLVALTGGFTDARTRRIPNWLTLSGTILGVGMNTFFSGASGFKLAIFGLAVAMAIYLPLYAIRAMGAGDVKFMAAIGSIVGPEHWLSLFVVTAVLGGLASFCLVMARGRLDLTLSNLSTITTELFHGRMPFHKDPSLDVHDKRAFGLPHGALIAIASLLFLLVQH